MTERDPNAVDYELEFTTPQGTVERAVVTATAIQESATYLAFMHNEDLVLSLPHSSVVHLGEVPLIHDLVRIDGDTQDAGKHLMFSDESHDPWADLSGRE